MKFDMGAQTLTTLTKQSSGSNQDLGALVRRFMDAASPLEGQFNGQGKASFDSFKSRSDQVSAELNSALASIVQGQSGMDTQFTQGDQNAADNARQAEGGADFDGARFGAR